MSAARPPEGSHGAVPQPAAWAAGCAPATPAQRSAHTRTLLPALALVALATSGCMTLSPVPTLELVKAAGTAAALAVTQVSPLTASSNVFQPPTGLQALCIEFNPGVSVPDMVTALQAELRRHAVTSRVLEAHSPPQACDVWLRYHASVAWDVRPVEGRLDMYIERLDLLLQDAQGRVLSHSMLDTVDSWLTGKWATTRAKVAPVVKTLLDGQEG